MRNFIKTVVTSVILATASFGAFAADVYVGTYDDGQTYINYYGQTEAGDLDKLIHANVGNNFSGHIWLNGPGGMAAEGQAIAEWIKSKGYTTIVAESDQCWSACASIWLGAGIDNRYLFEGGVVGFHLPYLPIDPLDPTVGNIYEDGKNAYGWQGVLDFHNYMIVSTIAADLSLEIKDVSTYVLKLAETNPSIFYEVDNSYDLMYVVGGQWIPAK